MLKQKKGATKQFFMIAELVFGAIVVLGLLFLLNTRVGDTVLEKNYVARDIALLMEAIYAAPGDLTYTYVVDYDFRVNIALSEIVVSDNKGDVRYWYNYNAAVEQIPARFDYAINKGSELSFVKKGNKLTITCSDCEAVSSDLPRPPEVNIALFIKEGGRLDWYKGKKHELIVHDAISDDLTKNTEVYTIMPDGSNKQCVTCNSNIPKGFVGQPAWHPDGEHIIIQVENSNSEHTIFNHLAWGINNDLWIIKRDGTGAELVWSSPLNHAALHPHFNEDGTKLMFAERIPTGKTYPALKDITPGGENQWDGWQIHIADFDITQVGKEKLSNHQIIFENIGGFYETHQFIGNKIVYSYTPPDKAYVDDIYTANLDGTNIQNLINSPDTWDEHGSYSPSGEALAFISSRFDSSWKAPASKPNTLRTELYLKDAAGEIKQITKMNEDGDPSKRYLVSDFDWDADGRRIAFQVAPVDEITGVADSPQIWIVTFPT